MKFNPNAAMHDISIVEDGNLCVYKKVIGLNNLRCDCVYICTIYIYIDVRESVD